MHQSRTVVYEDENIIVIFDDRGHRDILATFGDMERRPDGVLYWGEAAVNSAGLSGLGFVAKRPNWYPCLSLKKAEPLLSAIVSNRSVYTYGNSMGAYAAIKFMSVLGAKSALAVAPQFSIDPSDAGEFDKMYTKYFDNNLNRGCAINPMDITGNVYLLYDPYFPTDRGHADALSAISPFVKPLKMPFVRHGAIKHLASSIQIRFIIDKMREDNEGAIRSALVVIRRTHRLRAFNIVLASLRRHLDNSIKILNNFRSVLSPDHFCQMALEISRIGDYVKGTHIGGVEKRMYQQKCIEEIFMTSSEAEFETVIGVLQRELNEDELLHLIRLILGIIPEGSVIWKAAGDIHTKAGRSAKAEFCYTKAVAHS